MASSLHPPWAFQTKIHQQQRLFRTGLCAKLAPRAAGWTYRRVSTSAAGGKSLRTHRSASSSGNQVTTGQHLMGWVRDQLRAIWLEELGSCGIFGGSKWLILSHLDDGYPYNALQNCKNERPIWSLKHDGIFFWGAGACYRYMWVSDMVGEPLQHKLQIGNWMKRVIYWHGQWEEKSFHQLRSSGLWLATWWDHACEKRPVSPVTSAISFVLVLLLTTVVASKLLRFLQPEIIHPALTNAKQTSKQYGSNSAAVGNPADLLAYHQTGSGQPLTKLRVCVERSFIPQISRDRNSRVCAWNAYKKAP